MAHHAHYVVRFKGELELIDPRRDHNFLVQLCVNIFRVRRLSSHRGRPQSLISREPSCLAHWAECGQLLAEATKNLASSNGLVLVGAGFLVKTSWLFCVLPSGKNALASMGNLCFATAIRRGNDSCADLLADVNVAHFNLLSPLLDQP